ncbi:MAG: DUF4363 family protein [Oscillospiraceae bacterium]|nr:DUF4363 family protein [Oscillospiraceae bacterium]
MNHCKASVGILIGLILLCVSSLMILKSKSETYLAIIDQLETTFQTGSIEDTLVVYDTLESELEKYHNITGLFVNGTELDEMREIVASLKPMILANQKNTSAEIARLRMLVQNLYEEELPEFWNIL